MMPAKLTDEIIAAAIEGFEGQKKKIDDKIAELRSMLAGGSAEPTATPGAPVVNRRKISAAARKRMAEGQKARWAKLKSDGDPSSPATPEAPKVKRTISAEGMKRIIAAAKKRWAAKKAAETAQASAPVKKAPVKKAAVKKMTSKRAAVVVKKTASKKTAAKRAAPASAPMQAIG